MNDTYEKKEKAKKKVFCIEKITTIIYTSNKFKQLNEKHI